MTEEQIVETVTNFRKEMMAKQQEQAKRLGEKNKKEGEAFLAANAKKPGVKTLPSGLQYKIITEGKAHTVDVSPLSFERFARGNLSMEPLTAL